MKNFPGSVGSVNYSGFDRSSWILRTRSQHKTSIVEINKQSNKTNLLNAESRLGYRETILLKLPYFDPSKMLVIDPMHNLFLGTAKRMLSIWLDLEIIRRSIFNQIQAQVDSVIVPPGIGRIPLKILSGFSGFKADQFKNWVNIYSIPCLFAVLEADHLECWRHFVLGCRILCKQKLTADEIKLADALLLQFCRGVERMYGQGVITPNMHLHYHLKGVILDFGPSYEFWLFPFERYNGILGCYPTNNKNIEPQIMHRFLRDLSSSSFTFPSEFAENFRDICETLDITKQSSSVVDTQIGSNPCDFIIPRHSVYATFDKTDLSNLKILCCKLFNHTNSESLVVNTVYFEILFGYYYTDTLQFMRSLIFSICCLS